MPWSAASTSSTLLSCEWGGHMTMQVYKSCQFIASSCSTCSTSSWRDATAQRKTLTDPPLPLSCAVPCACARSYPVPPNPETTARTETYIGNWLKARGCREKVRSLWMHPAAVEDKAQDRSSLVLSTRVETHPALAIEPGAMSLNSLRAATSLGPQCQSWGGGGGGPGAYIYCGWLPAECPDRQVCAAVQQQHMAPARM